jgi:multiple sugar transport system substrate-binding protein
MELHGTLSRRALIGAAAAAPLALALPSCSDRPDIIDGRTVVRFSYLWAGAEAKAMEKVIAAFNRSQDRILVQGVSSPDSQQQLTAMSSSNGTFDISDQFGNSVGAWADRGILLPLDSYLDRHEVDVDDVVPAAMDQMVHSGHTYSLPIAVHDKRLLYNKTLLREAGVDVPTTMDELGEACRALTEQKNDGTITRLGMGNPSPSEVLTTLGFVFGGTWDAKDGNGPTPADPRNIQALQWWVDNVVAPVGADHLAHFESGNGEYLSAADPFFSGRTAMTIDGEWVAVQAAQVAPDLDWGAVELPTGVPGLEDANQLTCSTLFIPTNSRHKDEAAEFLAYLMSDRPMADFARGLGNLPARTSLKDSKKFQDVPGFGTFLDGLDSPHMKVLRSALYTQEYQSDLTSAFDAVLRASQTPEQAMQDVQRKAKNYETE